jgi:hypothetical protein
MKKLSIIFFLLIIPFVVFSQLPNYVRDADGKIIAVDGKAIQVGLVDLKYRYGFLLGL